MINSYLFCAPAETSPLYLQQSSLSKFPNSVIDIRIALTTPRLFTGVVSVLYLASTSVAGETVVFFLT